MLQRRYEYFSIVYPLLAEEKLAVLKYTIPGEMDRYRVALYREYRQHRPEQVKKLFKQI